MTENQKTNVKVVGALFLVHFSGDFYFAMIKPLLPVLAEKFSLTMTQVGFITGLTSILAFAIQPLFGYLADSARSRWIILSGPMIGAALIPLVGLAPNYGFVLLFLTLGSVSAAMYHPAAAGMVKAHAGRHIGLCMSVFGLGGTMGFTVAPLVATAWVAAQGLERLPFLSVFGLVLLVILSIIVPRPEPATEKALGFIRALRENLGHVWQPLVLIWSLSLFRAAIEQTFFTFFPVLFASEGYSLVLVGTIVSLFTVGGSVSALVCGHLVDRIGYRPVYYGSFGLAVPCLLAVLHVRGWGVYPLAFMTGFVSLATLFPALALAQQIAPRATSLVSSLIMGLAMGFGGMLVPLGGKLADIYGIKPVLTVVAVLPILALVLVRWLPEAGSRD